MSTVAADAGSRPQKYKHAWHCAAQHDIPPGAWVDPETHERWPGGGKAHLLGLALRRFSKPSILRTAIPCPSLPSLPCLFLLPAPPALHCIGTGTPSLHPSPSLPHLHRTARSHNTTTTGLADCFAATSSFEAASIPKHHLPPCPLPCPAWPCLALPCSRPSALDLTPDPSIKPDPPLPTDYRHKHASCVPHPLHTS